uniref:Uncharacterized protein n=1 Tax=Rhizophora mucronata TaxID=61149 RepID=A0A2P2R5C1_RHIMU
MISNANLCQIIFSLFFNVIHACHELFYLFFPHACLLINS